MMGRFDLQPSRRFKATFVLKSTSVKSIRQVPWSNRLTLGVIYVDRN